MCYYSYCRKKCIFWSVQISVLVLNWLLQLKQEKIFILGVITVIVVKVIFLECSKIRFTIKRIITFIAGESFYILECSKISFTIKSIITVIARGKYFWSVQ